MATDNILDTLSKSTDPLAQQVARALISVKDEERRQAEAEAARLFEIEEGHRIARLAHIQKMHDETKQALERYTKAREEAHSWLLMAFDRQSKIDNPAIRMQLDHLRYVHLPPAKLNQHDSIRPVFTSMGELLESKGL